jgi:DMSO/TMAO reductase YedYZ heme-binding membrane subunit
MSSHFWWYVARAGGIVAWALVLASCTWGLLHALRAFGRRPSPSWMLSTHRYLSALAIAFVAVHVVSILADGFVQFSLADVLVPMVSSWHPVAVAWGIVGMYVLVAVEVTSLVRARLSPRVWRGLHMLSYVLLALVTIHFLTAGTDTNDLLPTTSIVLIGVATVFGAAMLLTWRTAPKVRAAAPAPAAATELVTGR